MADLQKAKWKRGELWDTQWMQPGAHEGKESPTPNRCSSCPMKYLAGSSGWLYMKGAVGTAKWKV